MLSSDPDTVRLSELRDKAIWDEVSRMEGAKAEGIQQGVQQGLEQGLHQGLVNVARRMLAKGLTAEDVAEMTSLAIEEICRIESE